MKIPLIDGRFYIKEPIELSCSLYFDDGTCTSEKTSILFKDYIEVLKINKDYILLTYNGKKYIYWFFSGNLFKGYKGYKSFLDCYDNISILRDKKIDNILN